MFLPKILARLFASKATKPLLRGAPPPFLNFRMGLAISLFGFCYLAIGVRLFMLGVTEPPMAGAGLPPPSKARPDIVDRMGRPLARDYPTASVYAEPRRMTNIDEAVEGLTSVFPDLDPADLYKRLNSRAGFAWIKRVTTPEERARLWSLGIPGVGLREELKRLYPNGRAAAHVLGAVNVDNIGIAGMERWIDAQGLADLRVSGLRIERDSLQPVALSIDLRAQHALADELRKAVAKFSAVAGAGLILDVTNGEVIALVSLPDFDPNIPADALKKDNINRVNVGTFEMGSTFKALNTAMALDSGLFTIRSVLDASSPLRFGRMSIGDFRGQNRPLNVPESFIHSSNIAMGRMALAVGAQRQQAFLKQVGQLDRLTTELPEDAFPQVPKRWSEVTTATVSFGHGIAVTPLQASMAIASMVNGGTLIRPTFVKGAEVEPRVMARDVVSEQTGEALRFLMRLNARVGSGKKADIDGYYVGGKSGTAEKVVRGRYDSDTVLTAFMGVAPAHKPKYLFLTVLDEPKPLKETYGFRTSGWNAVPTTGLIMSRVLPILGVQPDWKEPENPFPSMVAARAWGSNLFAPSQIAARAAALAE